MSSTHKPAAVDCHQDHHEAFDTVADTYTANGVQYPVIGQIINGDIIFHVPDSVSRCLVHDRVLVCANTKAGSCAIRQTSQYPRPISLARRC